eukprot:TRINITY_DN66180_c0_g1_i1.p1 TRINITY_DN66180_c0_g1~~TRINITY_DN66180_c0_g1_i1.p1  ORF type:complete len:354 (+),score=60.26 TRINITY_DN66180_c0_g1_i1:30-1064(+)
MAYDPWQPWYGPEAGATAVAVAAAGSEVDAGESFEVIMSRLSASKDFNRTQNSTDGSTSAGEMSSSGFPSPKSIAASQPLRQVHGHWKPLKTKPLAHPKPFGPTTAVGGSFSKYPGRLRQKDLTSWEQERATMPERSYPSSAMSCVSKTLSATPIGVAAPVFESSTPQRSIGGSYLSASAPLARVAFNHEFCGDEVLSPVAISREAFAATGAASAPLPSTREVQPHLHKRKAPVARETRQVEVHLGPEDVDAQEVLQLKEYRRKLAMELRRTNQKLNTVCGSKDLQGPQTPSAGGPFAGRRAVMDRSNAASGSQKLSKAAATAYSYLGPGSDGPPLPEIHPLWS